MTPRRQRAFACVRTEPPAARCGRRCRAVAQWSPSCCGKPPPLPLQLDARTTCGATETLLSPPTGRGGCGAGAAQPRGAASGVVPRGELRPAPSCAVLSTRAADVVRPLHRRAGAAARWCSTTRSHRCVACVACQPPPCPGRDLCGGGWWRRRRCIPTAGGGASLQRRRGRSACAAAAQHLSILLRRVSGQPRRRRASARPARRPRVRRAGGAAEAAGGEDGHGRQVRFCRYRFCATVFAS